MLLAEVEFEALLKRLRKERTESPVVDGKEDLPLETDGDRAYFIRHMAALSNNVDRSYLIIGVEDKTWRAVGLSPDSPLRDPDETQRRLNQILANRLDPNVSVRYRTYEIDGVLYGLVAVEGASAPYVAAIEDQAYGGDRTQAAPSYIYRGAIYVRRGANSVIANRQSEVLDIVKRVRQVQETNGAEPDELLTAWNYLDTESADFGHHSLSKKLAELHSTTTDKFKGEYVPARSWVSFVFYPADGHCEIDTVALKDKLKPDQRIGRGAEWYQGIPKAFVDMLFSPRPTPREFVAMWHPPGQGNEQATHFIRIRPSGHIEVACTYPLFLQSDDVRFFSFVGMVGYLWQTVYLSKAIYEDAGCHGEITILVNLVGTNDTILADFAAQGQEVRWASPFGRGYRPSEHDVYIENNIQLKRTRLLAQCSGEDIESLIRDIAKDIGAYYGQDRPRCFDIRTDEFPHGEYASRWMRF